MHCVVCFCTLVEYTTEYSAGQVKMVWIKLRLWENADLVKAKSGRSY